MHSSTSRLFQLFLSTLSLRRATHRFRRWPIPCDDFYPRSPCGERLDVNNPVAALTSISIHALLAESDAMEIIKKLKSSVYFYPRSPCGERPFISRLHSLLVYFYPRSPCGERHAINGCNSDIEGFLSTLSLRRATLWVLRKVPILSIFLSTLSLRRATILGHGEVV